MNRPILSQFSGQIVQLYCKGVAVIRAFFFDGNIFFDMTGFYHILEVYAVQNIRIQYF